MRTIEITYYNALRLNSIIWVNYVAKIIDINQVTYFTSILQYALQQSGVVLKDEEQIWMDSILDINFFQNNFADSMIMIYRLLQLIQPQLYLPDSFAYVPSLVQVGAIEFIFPYQDGTYCYLDVLNTPQSGFSVVYIDSLIERSSTDPNISQEDRDFINSLINI